MEFYYMISCVIILYKSMASFVRSHSCNEGMFKNLFFSNLLGTLTVSQIKQQFNIEEGYFAHLTELRFS